MNETEIQRIAAAVSQLRPDWPAASLRTLLQRPALVDRPRRDVAVALVWIACEKETATPARVLEAGPWWKAAGVDGQTSPQREPYDPSTWCSVCSLPEPRCRRYYANDHDFESDIDAKKRRAEEAKRPRPRLRELTPKPDQDGDAA